MDMNNQIKVHWIFSYNNISVGDFVYAKFTPVYLYYRTYIGIKRNEIEYLQTTKKSLKKFLNINNFSQGKILVL